MAAVFLSPSTIFSLSDGCLYMECRVLNWLLPFSKFSLMVNPILQVFDVFSSRLLGGVVFYAADEVWLMLPDSC
mgnify:CR=1 FL=1